MKLIRKRVCLLLTTNMKHCAFPLAVLVFLLPFVSRVEAAEPFVSVAEEVVAVQRVGITGAGFAVASVDGKRVTLHYPNHPDDFGGSSGTGTAISSDGGLTWRAGTDDWPVPKSVDLWQDRLRDGSFVAMGIVWLPDPAKRSQIDSAEIPTNPWRLAISPDGQHWEVSDVTVKAPHEIGVIARPLPHMVENDDGDWYMPAYAWKKSGNRAILLKSTDRGREWSVFSTITTVASITKIGVPVSAPWLETMVSRTKDGSLLAVVRTGSNAEASIVSVRSSDDGLTWSSPEKVVAGANREPVVGKLPNLLRLPGGMLALLAAHSKRGCFLYLSLDGAGRDWSEGHLITKVTGGNTSMIALDENHLLVFTPASGRINCWRVTLR